MAHETALEKVNQLLGNRALQYYRPLFEVVSRMRGSGRLFKYISESSDNQQIADHLAAVQYAAIFAALKFEVVVEPCGRMGPDLSVSRDGHEAFVEITRFRKVNEGPSPAGDEEEAKLLPYGDLVRDMQKCWAKIVGKFRQVGDRESIIALWNDDDALEDIETEATSESLRRAAKEGQITIPSGIAFVLYGSSWIGPGPNPLGKQFYCFPISLPFKAHHQQWIRDIEDSTLAELITCAVAKPSTA